jgi:mannobiose 2-epimerase
LALREQGQGSAVIHTFDPFWRARARRRLTKMFERNILAFWAPRALAEDGGYHLDWDHNGKRMPRTPVQLIDQARMLYFFSRVSRSRFGDASTAEAAHRGFACLQARLLDPLHGGYFWDARDRDVGPDDTPPAGAPGWWRTKHVCGQAYALFALAEYARSFNHAGAAAAARAQFAAIRRHAADPAGGYREVLARDWSLAGDEHFSLLGPYPASAKSAASHMHLLEAMTAYHRVAPSAEVEAAMREIAGLLLRHGTPHAGVTEHGLESRYFADYRSRLSVGHCVKEIWYRLAALEQIGAATAADRAVAAAQYEYLFDAGYDRADGGFVDRQSGEGPPVKLWWIQAEALFSSLNIHLRCGSALARRGFLGTLAWIERFQADWHVGEWHAELRGHDVQPGPKSGPWKEPYHHGRAMLDGIELLK